MSISLITSVASAGTANGATTTGINTAGANLIVISVGFATAGTPTVSDAIGGIATGNVWTACGINLVGYLQQQSYYCFNPVVSSSANHTFTASGTGTAPSIAVVAFSGVPVVTPGVYASQDAALTQGISATHYACQGALVVSGIATIGVSHTISTGWSRVAVNFSSGVTVGGGIGWQIGISGTSNAAWNWAGLSVVASTVLAFPAFTSPSLTGACHLQRIQSTPVLANHNQGGGTVGGLQVDAFAAPAACWDGSRWVMTVSIWNIANNKWYSAFYTSTNLTTWTYVAGSLQSPAGSDYIIGNSGLVWFNSAYYWTYNHYPLNSLTPAATLASSTNLTTWTIVRDPVNSNYLADPALVVNPNTGNLELWGTAATSSGPRGIVFATSPDGSTWSPYSLVLSSPGFLTPTGPTFGEPQPFFVGSNCYCTCDGTGVGRTYRTTQLFMGPDLVFAFQDVNKPVAASAWETIQVFDCACLGLFDRGDGLGPQYWFLYAGGNNNSPTDNTDSCIGLAYLANDTTAAGPITLGSIVIAGAGSLTVVGSGSIALAGLTAAGRGSFTAPGSGSIALAGLTAAGRGSFTTTGSGSIALAGLNVAGSVVTLPPLYLPYEYTSVAIETGNENPFGIDPEATTIISAGLTPSD